MKKLVSSLLVFLAFMLIFSTTKADSLDLPTGTTINTTNKTDDSVFIKKILESQKFLGGASYYAIILPKKVCLAYHNKDGNYSLNIADVDSREEYLALYSLIKEKAEEEKSILLISYFSIKNLIDTKTFFVIRKEAQKNDFFLMKVSLAKNKK